MTYQLWKTVTKIRISFLFIHFIHLSLTAEQKLDIEGAPQQIPRKVCGSAKEEAKKSW